MQNTVFRLSSPHLGSNSRNLSLFDLGSKAIPFMRGVNRGMQICRSVMVFILGRPFNRLIIRRRDFVCMRRPSLTVIKYRDRAGF